jgi:hypothetical protein
VHTTAITKADRAALENLWGDAGTWAADTWTAHNAAYFDGKLRYHGIVFGLTPHGGHLAHTSPTGRITLHPALLDPQSDAWLIGHKLGERHATDTLLHEMIHAALIQRGDDSGHNGWPWCNEIMRITTELGLKPIKAAPVKPRRIDGKVVRLPLDGHLSRDEISRWPHTLRRAGYYTLEGRMYVPI